MDHCRHTWNNGNWKHWLGWDQLKWNDTIRGSYRKKAVIFQRLKKWYVNRRLVSPEVIFAQIIKGQKELEDGLEARLKKIEDVKSAAKSNGQTALYEEILRDERRLIAEAVLATAGYKMYLTEEQMIEFSTICEKGLRLDWIKNFSRFIPTDVIEKKNLADNLKIFDNYVILHYDPEGKFSRLTEEEIRKKKDPIMFGVMSSSRRLYFIGDWKDKYCDLTLEDVLKKFNEDGDNSNNILV